MARPDNVDPNAIAEAKREHAEREAERIAEGERRVAEVEAYRDELRAKPARRIGRRGFSRRQLARMDPGEGEG